MTRILCFALLLAASGCTLDAFDNPGDWSMTGASRRNVTVQAADPGDLIQGRSAADSNGVAAAAPVDKAIGGAAGASPGLLAPPANLPTMNITGS